MLCFLLAAQLAQAPSPMVENTRAHQRQTRRVTPGDRIKTALGDVVLPPKPARNPLPLVIHFHGAAWLIEQSVRAVYPAAAVLAVHLGAGSRVYAEPFREPGAFKALLEATGRSWGDISLSGFSAGYGAVREILRAPANMEQIRSVLLLDGIHASYAEPPEQRQPLADDLAPFLDFARLAVASRKSFLITHSEIFPGTFASTTECTDYLLGHFRLKRRPVVRWGPLGMQIISDTRLGGLEVFGFAGNSAPDHVDHLHAMSWALRRIRQIEVRSLRGAAR